MEVFECDLIAQTHEIEHPDGFTTMYLCFLCSGSSYPTTTCIGTRTTQRERLLGRHILIAINSWPADSHYPLGYYVKTMGETGNKDVETEVLLHEYNIPCAPFPAKVRTRIPVLYSSVCCVSAVLLESTEALSTMMDSYISLF